MKNNEIKAARRVIEEFNEGESFENVCAKCGVDVEVPVECEFNESDRCGYCCANFADLARTGWPVALDEVERLRAENETLRSQLDDDSIVAALDLNRKNVDTDFAELIQVSEKHIERQKDVREDWYDYQPHTILELIAEILRTRKVIKEFLGSPTRGEWFEVADKLRVAANGEETDALLDGYRGVEIIRLQVLLNDSGIEALGHRTEIRRLCAVVQDVLDNFDPTNTEKIYMRLKDGMAVLDGEVTA